MSHDRPRRDHINDCIKKDHDQNRGSEDQIIDTRHECDQGEDHDACHTLCRNLSSFAESWIRCNLARANRYRDKQQPEQRGGRSRKRGIEVVP
jgi:hypothetical protein